jgi:glycosyltransferase involved in cell wall biosynthesis
MISIVVPIYNNQCSITELTTRISIHLSDNNLPFEIIYVNDHSIDNSLNLLTVLKSQYSCIKLIDLGKNIGQHRAILKGLKIAQGNRIVVMDGDLQDKPELITQMSNLCCSESDMVFILREGSYQSYARMISSFVIKMAIQKITGLNYKAGSYFMFSSQSKNKIINLGSRCMFPYVSILAAVSAVKIIYLKSERLKSKSVSNYSLMKRLQAGFHAIYCAVCSKFYLNRIG